MRISDWSSDVCSSDLDAVRDADCIIVRAVNVTAELMDRCPRLKIVAKHGAGMDNIDIPAATARGLVVTHTGGANSPAVAEAAVMLMLATLRRVPQVHNLVLEGRFQGDRKSTRLNSSH